MRVQNNNSNTDSDNISYTVTDTDNIASPSKSNLHKWMKDTHLDHCDLIRNLNVDGCPTKQNLFEESTLLMNAKYIVFT